jgi:Tfp pilus assembly protein PilV
MNDKRSEDTQSGFGLIELLLVLVFIGLVVVAGLLLSNRNSTSAKKAADAVKPTSTTKAVSKSETPTTPQTDYANSNFSLSYPTAWTVHSHTNVSNNYICLYSPDAVEASRAYQTGFCGYVVSGATLSAIVMANSAKAEDINTTAACLNGDTQSESQTTINGKTALVFDCALTTPSVEALPDYHVITTRIPYNSTTWLDVEYYQALVGNSRYSDAYQQLLKSIKLLSPIISPHYGG